MFQSSSRNEAQRLVTDHVLSAGKAVTLSPHAAPQGTVHDELVLESWQAIIEGERILSSAHKYLREEHNFRGQVWAEYNEALTILETASRRNGGYLGLSDDEVNKELMFRSLPRGEDR